MIHVCHVRKRRSSDYSCSQPCSTSSRLKKLYVVQYTTHDSRDYCTVLYCTVHSAVYSKK